MTEHRIPGCKAVSRYFLAIVCCLTCVVSTAQRYFIKQYQVEKGLPSDIIKATAQDSQGYFWIATDEGLVRYDGVRFTSYRDKLHSNYTKGFITTSKGKLIAFGDLDLIEIAMVNDVPEFKSLFPVARAATDTSISYPKLVYESVQGDLWISESQAVVRLRNNKIQRYNFDMADRSPQFLRSFSFFEDLHGDLFAISFKGNVFRYDIDSDAFVLTAISFPAGVEFVSRFGVRLVVGSSEGLSYATLESNGGFGALQMTLKGVNVSYVTPAGGNYFIATRGSRHFIATPDFNSFTVLPETINNVNHVYQSREKDLWISGNEGLVMMRENLFQPANDKVVDFIESVTEDPQTGEILYATSHTLYAFDRLRRQSRELLNLPDGYFQSLITTSQGTWVANAFKVFLLRNGKSIKEFDFSEHRRFVTALASDAAGNVWLTIPGLPEVLMIDQKLDLHRYTIPLCKESAVSMVRPSAEGVFVAAAGSKYLFFKSSADSTFRDVSLRTPYSLSTSFHVKDIAMEGNSVWLATSEGLLKQRDSTIVRIGLGPQFTTAPIESILIHSDNKLLISTAMGMILFDIASGAYDLFNESTGVLSNTITSHGFFVSRDQTVWIGSPKGLCYSAMPLTRHVKTQTPRIVSALADGRKIAVNRAKDIAHGSFIAIQLSAITFPENEVTFQYRLLPGDVWHTTSESELHFSDLNAGKRVLEVRAKKNGPFEWSDISRFSFSIDRPYWESWWFVALCLATIIVVAFGTFLAVNARSLKRTRQLEHIVSERTNELRIKNEELVNLNHEKNNFIGIVAHDLKSPLKQMMGMHSIIRLTSKLDDETSSYIGMLESTARRLDQMIGKILDVDAIESQKLNLTLERVDLSSVINGILERYRNAASNKRIEICSDVNQHAFVTADRNYVEQVLENLLSNAIKFSPFDKRVFVSLSNRGDDVVCSIRDEGPGISDEDKLMLFGKYQKLTARPTGDEISTGLGLSIVKRFVEAMNGKVWCESELGKGACFSLSLKGMPVGQNLEKRSVIQHQGV